MVVRKERFSNMGKIKKSTNDIVDDALAKQSSWADEHRARASEQLSRRHAPRSARVVNTGGVGVEQNRPRVAETQRKSGFWATVKSYWFPIVCAIVVVILIIWLIFALSSCAQKSDAIPEPTTRVVATGTISNFDIVRIGRDGRITIAGRGAPNSSESIMVNGKTVMTVATDKNGEFTYAPKNPFAPGNYVIKMSGSDNDVFVYIPEGTTGAYSLLMGQNGSQIMQYPAAPNDKLVIQKIDYLASGRIVVTGRALPRLRVDLTMDDKPLGTAITSDYKNFGLGANIEKLSAGENHTIKITLHDGTGHVIAVATHDFAMPKMTPADDTYYTVRRGDALWIISRNFLGLGHIYTMIVNANKIKNPDLIYPNQQLKIPVVAK